MVVARFGTSNGESAFGPEAAFIALVPTILYWLLDSYYLALERGFRESSNSFVTRLHAGVLEKDEMFVISPTGSVKGQTFACLWRFATCPLYGTLAAVTVVFTLIAELVAAIR